MVLKWPILIFFCFSYIYIIWGDKGLKGVGWIFVDRLVYWVKICLFQYKYIWNEEIFKRERERESERVCIECLLVWKRKENNAHICLSLVRYVTVQNWKQTVCNIFMNILLINRHLARKYFFLSQIVSSS